MSDLDEMMKKALEDLGIPEKDAKRKARIIDDILAEHRKEMKRLWETADDATTTTKPRSLEELHKYMNETWTAGETVKLTKEEEELLRAEEHKLVKQAERNFNEKLEEEILKGSWLKLEDYMNKVYEGLGMPCGPSISGWKKDDPEPEPEPAPSDSVNHPSHYTFGDIEVIDYIRDKLTPEEFQGYCNGNVLKYISRWQHKGGVEDLKKADVYLCWMIESALGEAEQK